MVKLIVSAKYVVLILAGCFFLLFGIHLLFAAYELKDPFNFVMTFFASNLIILISAVLIIGFVIRLFSSIGKREGNDPT